MSEFDAKEKEEMIRLIVQSMSQMIGPTSDMVRARMAAEVDGLIDARRRFLEAGWPEWMINSIMLGMLDATPIGAGGPRE